MKKNKNEGDQPEGFTRSISLYWNWVRGQKAASKVGKGLTRSSTALILQCEHWLEAADPKHRYGTNLRPYFDFWLEQQTKGRDASARHHACIPYSAIPEIAVQAAAEAAARPAASVPAAVAAAAAAVAAAAAAGGAAGNGPCSCEQAATEAAEAAAEAAAAAAAACSEPDEVACTPRRSRSAPNLIDIPPDPDELDEMLAAEAEAVDDETDHVQQAMQDADGTQATANACAATDGTCTSSSSSSSSKQRQHKQPWRGRHTEPPLSIISSPSMPVVTGALSGPPNLPGYHTDDRFFYWLDEGSGREIDLRDRGVSRSKLERERVQYLTGAERAQLEVTVDSSTGLLVYKISGQLVHTVAGEPPAVVQLRCSGNNSTGVAAAAAAAPAAGPALAAAAAGGGSSALTIAEAVVEHWKQQSSSGFVQQPSTAAVPSTTSKGNSLPRILEGDVSAVAANMLVTSCPQQQPDEEEEEEEEDLEEEEEEEQDQQHGPFTPLTQQRREQQQRQRAALQQLQQDIWQHSGGQQQQQQQHHHQQQSQLTLQHQGQQQQQQLPGASCRDAQDIDTEMTDADAAAPSSTAACGAQLHTAAGCSSSGVAEASSLATPATPTAAAYGAVAGLATPGTTGLSQRRQSLGAAGDLKAAAASSSGAQPACNGMLAAEQQHQWHKPTALHLQQQQQQLPAQPLQWQQQPQQQQPAQQTMQQQQQPQGPIGVNGSSSHGACMADAGGPVQLPKEKPCKWIYVLDTSQRLFVHAKYKGKFHHSSFLQGGAVLSAGGIVVENGRILKLTADSGHYRPNFENFMSTVQLLKDWGADLTQTKLSAKHIKCPQLPDVGHCVGH